MVSGLSIGQDIYDSKCCRGCMQSKIRDMKARLAAFGEVLQRQQAAVNELRVVSKLMERSGTWKFVRAAGDDRQAPKSHWCCAALGKKRKGRAQRAGLKQPVNQQCPPVQAGPLPCALKAMKGHSDCEHCCRARPCTCCRFSTTD
eukprot:1142273-Pelagomonas_calceolata.AAC.2